MQKGSLHCVLLPGLFASKARAGQLDLARKVHVAPCSKQAGRKRGAHCAGVV